jgi:hypothetical protein
MSDLIVCKVSFLKNSTLTEAYRSIEVDKKKIRNYLLSKEFLLLTLYSRLSLSLKFRDQLMQTEELSIICLLDLPKSEW